MELRKPRQLSDVGTVLWLASACEFEVIVANAEQVVCYGVYNRVTGLIESYTNSFAKARYLCQEFHKDLSEGYDRIDPRANAGAILQSLLDQAPNKAN